MGCETYEDLSLKKHLADLVTLIPSGGDFQVTEEQRTQMNNSIWIPIVRRLFFSGVKKVAESQERPAVLLHNFRKPTHQELAKHDPTNTEYQLFLTMKEWEKKVKRGQTELTDAMREAKFVVGRVDEPEEVQNLSHEAVLKHEENLLQAKHMIRLIHFLPEGTDTEFCTNAINEINSIFRGDYGGPAATVSRTDGNP